MDKGSEVLPRLRALSGWVWRSVQGRRIDGNLGAWRVDNGPDEAEGASSLPNREPEVTDVTC